MQRKTCRRKSPGHAERAPYAKEGQEIRYFRFPREALPGAAAELLKFANRGKVSRAGPNGIEQRQLELDIQLLRHYRPFIEELASGDMTTYSAP